MRAKDRIRFATEFNLDMILLSKFFEITLKPKWDILKQKPFNMRGRFVLIFLRACNKLITRLRVGKRISKIKKRFKELGLDTVEKMIAFVEEDQKRSLAA